MQRRMVRWLTAVLIVVVGMLSQARGMGFDYVVERVEYDGCGYGPYDGTIDLVDDFADMSNWVHNLGTTTVSAGQLHLQSPGDVVPIMGLQLERSEVHHTPVNHLHKADGCLIRTVWVVDPGTQLYPGISFATLITNGMDILVMGVINYNDTDAASANIEPGLRAIQTRSNSGLGGLLSVTHTIAESDFTGEVWTELWHDPDSIQFTTQISLDSGTTYVGFPAQDLFVSSTGATIILYADPLEGAAPATPTPVIVPPEAMTCYKAKDKRMPPYVRHMFTLADQFQTQTGSLKKLAYVCAPTSVDGSTVANAADHLCCHKMIGTPLIPPVVANVTGVNTGDTSQVEISKPALFCDPCSKTLVP